MGNGSGRRTTNDVIKLIGADLSAAEVAVVKALCNGMKPIEIAELRETSINTVRSQLKAIYRKTKTHRQAELLSLVLSGQSENIE